MNWPDWITAGAAIVALYFSFDANRRTRLADEHAREREQAAIGREDAAIAADARREEAAQAAADRREREAEKRAASRQAAAQAAARYQPLRRAIEYAELAYQAYIRDLGTPTGTLPRREPVPIPEEVRLWHERAPELAADAEDADVHAMIERLRSSIQLIELPLDASNISLRGAIRGIVDRGGPALADAKAMLPNQQR